ncbi:MAG: ABC transporter substrate-binding protein [Candidatus Lokiarchaeia archaeon]|nr:ABC transporter substrate-binding protein [Candidatus Lokiarchaeia archaeon]
MEMEKKNLAIIILAIVLAASGVGNVILGIQSGFLQVVAPRKGGNLVVGAPQGDIVHLDPAYAYDSASINVIDQVVERLYWFDLADKEGGYPPVPALATALPTISPNGLEYTIPIRQGVKFHDGTPLNASAVKWSFDRLQWFGNYSGNQYLPAPFNTPLPTSLPSGIPTPTQLWGAVYINGDETPILNKTEVVDTYTIKMTLNQPRAAWFSIMCFCGSGILSPSSTPANDYLTLSDDLVGTGPFIYDAFLAGSYIKLSSNPDYWQGQADLDTITVLILPDDIVASQALLSGDVDIVLAPNPAFLDQMSADPDVNLVYGGGTLRVSWVTFNYHLIPLTMRKAISYCLNYSYIIDVVYDRVAVRWPTFIPMGIAFANYTLNYPTFDRAAARDLLLNDAYYGPLCAARNLTASSTDQDWLDVAASNPLEAYNYTWNIGNTLRHGTGDRLAFDMPYIGCTLLVNGIAWGDMLGMMVSDREHLSLYQLGWLPDYQDPENYISAIWGNTSAINGGDYDQPDVMVLMAQGLTETDLTVRKHIYDEIQQKMVERDFPGTPLVQTLDYDAFRTGVEGYITNPIGNVWWYTVHFT